MNGKPFVRETECEGQFWLNGIATQSGYHTLGSLLPAEAKEVGHDRPREGPKGKFVVRVEFTPEKETDKR